MVATREAVVEVARAVRAIGASRVPQAPDSDEPAVLRGALRHFAEWAESIRSVCQPVPEVEEEDDEDGRELLELRERLAALEGRVESLANTGHLTPSRLVDVWNAELLASDDVLPVGVIALWGAADPPTKWLILDGSEVSQTTYAELYALWSTTFNTGGEGAGNFRLPDMRRRYAVGLGTAPWNTLGATEGSAENVRDPDSHLHGIAFNVDSTSVAHIHNVSGDTGAADAQLPVYGGGGAAASTDYHGHPVNIDSGAMSANDPHEHAIDDDTDSTDTWPPHLVLNFIVYTGVAA